MRQSVQTHRHEVHTESVDLSGRQPRISPAFVTEVLGAVGGQAAQGVGTGQL
jgi:hypothetical protein